MTKRLSVEKCKALSLFVISEQTYDALRTQAEAVKRDTKALQALFSKHIPAFQNKPKANRVRHPHVYVAFLVLESIASIPAVMTETLDHQNLGHIRTSLHSTNKLMSVAEASAWRSGQMYRSPKTSQSKTEPKAKTELERKPTPEKPVEVSRTELAIESLKKAKSLSDVYGAASKFFPAWRRTEAGVPHGDNQELLLAFHEAGFPNADIQSVMLSNTGDVDERLKAAGRTPNKAPNRFAPNSAAA